MLFLEVRTDSIDEENATTCPCPEDYVPTNADSLENAEQAIDKAVEEQPGHKDEIGKQTIQKQLKAHSAASQTQFALFSDKFRSLSCSWFNA